MTTQYPRIYLTLYDPECDDEGPVWWIDERMSDSDVEYVNVATFDTLTAQRDHWKANHDAQVAIKRKLSALLSEAHKRIADLESLAGISAREHAASTLGDGFAPSADMTVPLSVENAKQAARIAELENSVASFKWALETGAKFRGPLENRVPVIIMNENGKVLI